MCKSKKANNEIQKESDPAKKKALAEKYDKQITAKRDANTKAYTTKLQAIDKSINETIILKAKSLGYDIVLTKGAVLYGGNDITDAVMKTVK